MAAKNNKTRLDDLVAEKGLAPSATRARALILAGNVVVNDQLVDKPGTRVASDADVRLKGKSLPYVSRGGTKLEAALKLWPAPLHRAVCVDVGASTGGFTDVLLQHGASKVFAVDVGYGQLDWKLRSDPRVVNLERTHILNIAEGAFDPKPTVAVVDVSFISLLRIIPALKQHLAAHAFLYLLVKPQFEVNRAEVEKGGIVRDDAARIRALERILDKAAQLGFALRGFAESPIRGADGNIEFICGFELIS